MEQVLTAKMSTKKKRYRKKKNGLQWKPRYGERILTVLDDIYPKFTDLLLENEVYPPAAPTLTVLLIQKLISNNVVPANSHANMFLNMAALLIKAADECVNMNAANMREQDKEFFNKMKTLFEGVGYNYADSPGYYKLENMHYHGKIN